MTTRQLVRQWEYWLNRSVNAQTVFDLRLCAESLSESEALLYDRLYTIVRSL